jgi:hypothetical protein
MKRYRLPLVSECPIPSDVEAALPQPVEYYYLASDVDARIAKLEKENVQYSRQLFTIGQILGDWATSKHAFAGKLSSCHCGDGCAPAEGCRE